MKTKLLLFVTFISALFISSCGKPKYESFIEDAFGLRQEILSAYDNVTDEKSADEADKKMEEGIKKFDGLVSKYKGTKYLKTNQSKVDAKVGEHTKKEQEIVTNIMQKLSATPALAQRYNTMLLKMDAAFQKMATAIDAE